MRYEVRATPFAGLWHIYPDYSTTCSSMEEAEEVKRFRQGMTLPVYKHVEIVSIEEEMPE